MYEKELQHDGNILFRKTGVYSGDKSLYTDAMDNARAGYNIKKIADARRHISKSGLPEEEIQEFNDWINQGIARLTGEAA
jgi:hypothetical protein